MQPGDASNLYNDALQRLRRIVAEAHVSPTVLLRSIEVDLKPSAILEETDLWSVPCEDRSQLLLSLDHRP